MPVLEHENKSELKMNVPDNWLTICAEEVNRGKLTSLPQKLEFAKTRNMDSLDEVHAWMLKTRADFVAVVEKALLQENRP